MLEHSVTGCYDVSISVGSTTKRTVPVSGAGCDTVPVNQELLFQVTLCPVRPEGEPPVQVARDHIATTWLAGSIEAEAEHVR